MKKLIILLLIFTFSLAAQTDSTKFKGGNGSGYAMGISGSNTPLPVELYSFSAIVNKENVLLKWQTKTEIDNYGFEIERCSSKNSFKTIGFKEGFGNSNSPKSYEFIDDEKLSNRKYYYRLKQIDSDGSFEYSKIIETDINRILSYTLSQNYPNPFNPVTNISFQIPIKGLVAIKLYNILGNEVAVILNQAMEEGEHTIQFDATGLSSGIYFYKIFSGSFSDTKKLTLLK